MIRGRELLTESRLQAALLLTSVGVLGATVVSPTLSGMADGFELTDARVALVMTAFFLPATVTLPVVGTLTDVVGRRPVALTALFVYGATGVAIGVAPRFDIVLALRVVQGCVFPGLIPLSIAVIGDIYEDKQGTQAQGFRSSVNGLTGIVFPALAGVVAGISWRLPYAFYGLTFLVLIFCFLTLPESASNEDRGPEDDRRDVRDRTLAVVGEVTDALRAPVLAVIGATFSIFLVRYALLTFVPLYVVIELHGNEALGGFAVAVMGLGRFVGGPAAGSIVERSSRRVTLFGTQLLFVAGTVLLAVVRNPWLLLLPVGVLSLGEGIFNPVATDFITAAAPTAVRGRVVSVLEVGKAGAIAAAPVAFGAVLAATSYRVAFLTGAVVVASVALVVVSGVGQTDSTSAGKRPHS